MKTIFLYLTVLALVMDTEAFLFRRRKMRRRCCSAIQQYPLYTFEYSSGSETGHGAEKKDSKKSEDHGKGHDDAEPAHVPLPVWTYPFPTVFDTPYLLDYKANGEQFGADEHQKHGANKHKDHATPSEEKDKEGHDEEAGGLHPTVFETAPFPVSWPWNQPPIYSFPLGTELSMATLNTEQKNGESHGSDYGEMRHLVSESHGNFDEQTSPIPAIPQHTPMNDFNYHPEPSNSKGMPEWW